MTGRFITIKARCATRRDEVFVAVYTEQGTAGLEVVDYYNSFTELAHAALNSERSKKPFKSSYSEGLAYHDLSALRHDALTAFRWAYVGEVEA